MNTLETFLAESGRDEVTAMDDLQNGGIVSDLCVNARDVAEADCPAAVSFLKGRLP